MYAEIIRRADDDDGHAVLNMGRVEGLSISLCLLMVMQDMGK